MTPERARGMSFNLKAAEYMHELEQRAEAQRDTIRNIRAIFHQYLRKTKEVRLDLLAREKDCRELQQQVEALTEKYNDLIMQVQVKIPNETRHETARRIIQQHENRESFTATAQQEGSDGIS